MLNNHKKDLRFGSERLTRLIIFSVLYGTHARPRSLVWLRARAHDFGSVSKIKRIFKVFEISLMMTPVRIYAFIQRQIISQVSSLTRLNLQKKPQSSEHSEEIRFLQKVFCVTCAYDLIPLCESTRFFLNIK